MTAYHVLEDEHGAAFAVYERYDCPNCGRFIFKEMPGTRSRKPRPASIASDAPAS